jgi:hypothetical protein
MCELILTGYLDRDGKRDEMGIFRPIGMFPILFRQQY